jgi:nuclear pore complex protein Nup188
MKVDSELKEILTKSHLAGTRPFFALPLIKRKYSLMKKLPFISSKYEWFKYSACSISSTSSVSISSGAVSSLVIRDRSSGDSDSCRKTRFTEIMAVQIYRIAFLIMKFLCSRAKEAVKRADELEFLDLAHFPELPMPDILHDLQVTIANF